MAEIDAALHRQIGELTAEVRALREDLRRIEATSARAKSDTDASRAVVHRRMDDLVDEVADVKSTVNIVQADVRDMKPVTDDVRRWKLMGVGALGMIGIGGIALGVSFADAAKRLFGLLLGRV